MPKKSPDSACFGRVEALTNTLTNISKSAGGLSGQYSYLGLQIAEAKVPGSTEYQGVDVTTYLHTQEVTGSSPVVSTKKFLISLEIRNFFFILQF